MILSDLLPNKDHRISSSDFCLKPSNLWFKLRISTSLLSSLDVRTSNEVLTTSLAIKNWLLYRLSAFLYQCITCCSLPKDTDIFMFLPSLPKISNHQKERKQTLKCTSQTRAHQKNNKTSQHDLLMWSNG